MAGEYKNPHNNPKLNVDKIRTHLTGLSIFMMGMIDAYAVIVHGTLVSAQTGNLATLSREMFSRNWPGIWKHVIVFVGFAIGAFAGKAVQELLRKSWRRFRVYLLFQSVLLFVLALVQTAISSTLLVFLLALLAGYDLALFRNFHDTRVNNGVMTGNTKNMMSSLFLAIYYKDPVAGKDSRNLLLAVLLFVSGVGIGSLIVAVNPLFNLWVAFGLVFTYMAWLTYLNVR